MCYSVQTYMPGGEAGNKTPVHTSRYDIPRLPTIRVSGFTFPRLPIQTSSVDQIDWVSWGLIPAWATNEDIRQHTLNARIETLAEKPTFRDIQHQRCLMFVAGFYEWQWLDPKGKRKQPFFIHLDSSAPLVMGGLVSQWIDPKTSVSRTTCTIVTREAVGIMEEIHNSKKRMPVILEPHQELAWLKGNLPEPTVSLQAEPLIEPGQLSLF